jgi:hypothetical protein
MEKIPMGQVEDPEEVMKAAINDKEKERKAFVGRETVNGVKIVVEWDNGYDDYVIYFPQIEIGEAASEKGIHDQTLRITRKPDVAKVVFDYACQLAKNESDVYKIYKSVEDFSGDLQYDD